MKSHHDMRISLAVIAVALAAGFAFQGTRGLFESTEGRYAESSREMLETGDWLVPQLDYEPHWTKPPLTYWSIAGGMALLGVNEWGARLPGAVAFVLTAWAVMQLGTTLWGRRTGWLAGLIYATAPFAVGAANTINTDTLLALWTVLITLAYWHARREVVAGRTGRLGVALMWLFAGAGFLTKGPPSLLILLVVIVCHVVDRRQGRPVPRLLSPWGIPLFVLVGFGWYAWAAATHPGLVNYWFGDEVVGRIGTDEFGRNTEWYKPFVVYLPPLVFGLGLWVLVAVGPVLRDTRALWRNSVVAGLRDRPVLRFLAAWIVLPLAVFSISKSRLPLYVLPLLPAVALVAARSLAAAWSPQRLGRVAMVVGIVSLALAVGGKAVLSYWPLRKDERTLYRAVERHAPADVRVVNSTSRELYGLTFYMRGRVERIDQPEAPAQIDEPVREVVAKVLGRPAGVSYAIVTRTKDLRIPDALDREDVEYERVTAPLGTIVFVAARASPPK